MNCAICGIITNHSTEQHEQAVIEQQLCTQCGQPHQQDEPDAHLCRACASDVAEYLSEQASYYVPEESDKC